MPPFPRLRRHAAVLALPVLLPACGGEETNPLPPGRYAYTASHATPDGGQPVELAGVLEIYELEGDSLRGRWDAEQLHPELEGAVLEDAGAAVYAHPTYFGTIVHRVRRGAGGAVSCDGEYSWIAAGGVERSVPLTCALSDAVPAGAGVPAPGGRAVRKAQDSPIVAPVPDRQP